MTDTPALDRIDVDDLQCRAIIGIYPAERIQYQDVLVQLSMWTDIAKASKSDSIEDALDYKRVTKRVIELVRDSRYQLIETLIEDVAQTILREFDVERVRVRVDKPGALRFARSVGITIERTKS